MQSDHRGGFETVIRHYFRQPDALSLIEDFVAAPVDEHWRAQTVLTLPVFLALMLDGSPKAAASLVAAIKGGDPVKVEVVAQALNYSHHPQRRRLMESLVGEHAAASMDAGGADFKDFAPTHPVHVDMLWAAFFATGDAAYVMAIARLLAGWMPDASLQGLLETAAHDEGVAQKAMAGILAATAQDGLAARAREMTEVRTALAAYAAAQDGLGSALAAKILAGNPA